MLELAKYRKHGNVRFQRMFKICGVINNFSIISGMVNNTSWLTTHTFPMYINKS